MKAEDLGHLDEELTHPKTNVLLRDFSIFSVKLIVDGLKDVVHLVLQAFGRFAW